MDDLKKMSIQDLGKARADALAKYKALEDNAKAEARSLTADEEAQAEQHIEFAEKVSAEIDDRNKTTNRRARAAAVANSTATATRPYVSEVKEGFEEDPQRGFKSRQDYFKAVMDAGISGVTEDKRLNYLAAVGGDEHSTSNDAYGGYLVPEGFVGGLLTVDPEIDFIASRVQSVPMTSNRVYLNARVDKNHSTSVTGGFRVYRNSETGTVSASRGETERVYLNAESLMGIAYASEELIQDSPLSIAQIVGNSFASEFSSKILDERINGTGVGEFEGVLNSPALVTVPKETGQSADTVLFENIVKMYARCWRPSQAIWIANYNVLPQLMLMNQNVGTAGVPAWQPSARDGVPMTLLGLPIFFTEYCPTVGDVGDLILGNWSQYLEGTRQGITSAESVHVRFVYNERAFRFTMRNDGRCWWRSALTPKKGSDTLSPFVALAAR